MSELTLDGSVWALVSRVQLSAKLCQLSAKLCTMCPPATLPTTRYGMLYLLFTQRAHRVYNEALPHRSISGMDHAYFIRPRCYEPVS